MTCPVASAKRKVLIVDDNANAALLLSMFLDACGHETAVAYGGAEGIELAETFRPQIVFFDLGMPKMSGYEVAVALRRLPCLATVYIAALTGWNDPKTRQQVIAAGFDKHLTKPAKIEVVLELVEHAGA